MSPGSQSAPSKDEIEAYLSKSSDFAFEMKVLQSLSKIDRGTSFSGSYVDPVTGKQRQYDFQSRLKKSDTQLIFCIEAKNIRSDKPVIVHRTARQDRESFFDAIVGEGGHGGTSYSGPTIKRVVGRCALFKAGEQVGRSMDQLGGTAKEDHLYDKFSQASNHIGSLLRMDRKIFTTNQTAFVFIPILVIPDDALWVADYDSTGQRIGASSQTEVVSYYLGTDWECEHKYKLKYSISHLFICTESAIQKLIEACTEKSLQDFILSYEEAAKSPNNREF
jgi:hypothetical protein